jgi:hypothetical protein
MNLRWDFFCSFCEVPLFGTTKNLAEALGEKNKIKSADAQTGCFAPSHWDFALYEP